jgi:hypothetical protein
MASNGTVISEWWIGKGFEGIGYGIVFRYYPGIRLEGLRETTRNLSQGSRPVGRELNSLPPEYEEGMLTTTFDVIFSYGI